MYLAHKQRRNQIELPSTVHPPAHYSEPFPEDVATEVVTAPKRVSSKQKGTSQSGLVPF